MFEIFGIEDAAEWMGDSNLKMNDDETELMAIGTRSNVSQVNPNLAPLSVSGCDIPFSQCVRNLGFYIYQRLSMDGHNKYLCRILFGQLLRIGEKKKKKKNRSFLSTDAAKKTCCFSHCLEVKLLQFSSCWFP